MSHIKERNDKTCLNCNAHLYGRYCHVCGQENIEEKQSFGHLVTHFVNDVTHFDGKFFSTLKYLLFRPGFLSKEFLRGRRASYLDPIRMYVFTSAIFFLILFSFGKSDDLFKVNTDTRPAIDSAITSLKKEAAVEKDSVVKNELLKQIKTLEAFGAKDSSKVKTNAVNVDDDTTYYKEDSSDTNKGSIFDMNLPHSIKEYEAEQKKLPADKKDNWLNYRFKEKLISLNEKYHANPGLFKSEAKEKFLHAFPQMMFVSLPLAALILQLLYMRRRKQFYYVSHTIFTLHVYIATYILLLMIYTFSALHNSTHWQIFAWLQTISVISIFFYFYKAVRNFYEQGRAKTLLKMSLATFLYFIVIVLLIVIFFFISLFQL